MYESEPDQIVFSVDKPVQLLGVGLCATDTLYTVRLAVLEVRPVAWGCFTADLAAGILADKSRLSHNVHGTMTCVMLPAINIAH